MTDMEYVLSFIKEVKKAYKEFDNKEIPELIFPIGISSAYKLALNIEKLIKKQKTQKPHSIITSAAGVSFASCPCCGEHIDENRNPKFCGNCGQAVKWE